MKEQTKDINRAKKLCFNLLRIRLRSEFELEQYLTKRGFDKEVIQRVKEYLVKLNLLDDFSFAKAWIESKVKRAIGKERIKYELLKKGIPKNIITKALEQTYNVKNEEEMIKELILQRMKRYSHLNKDTAKRRLWSYLLRRGFSKDIVLELISQQ